MAQADRPNIVLIMTDQQRYDTIAALGYGHAITPHLDRLVREGTAFTNTYVTAPSCAPSRSSLFTGLYPHTLGVLGNDDVWTHSWVESLASSGYRCVNVGKMHTFPYEGSAGFHERHVVENKDRGTDRLPFLLDNWDKALWTHGAVKPDRRTLKDLPDYRERLGAFMWTLPEHLHADNFVGALSRHWLKAYPQRPREPFFLQVGFPGPHPPYDAVGRHLDAYADRELPLPVGTRADIESQPEPLKELRRTAMSRDMDSVVHLDDPTPEQVRRQRQHYLANISMIDEQIGGILDALDERGVLDETVIIFTSDHGDALNDHGHSQKWTMYEPSVHVPAVVWGPGRVDAGKIVESLTSAMDLGPTILELAGVQPPNWMAARSLVPALTQSSWPERAYVFSEHARDQILTGTGLMTMVRDQRWKLVEFVDCDDGQLFDLLGDPHEEHNLWHDPDLLGVRTHLQRVIATWRAQTALDAAEWLADAR